MATRPSASLKHLRDRGHKGVAVVEKFVAFHDAAEAGPRSGQRAKFGGGYRKDLFGFADLIAFRRESPGCLFVQCTTKGALTAHLRKFRRDLEVRQNILDCLAAGNRVVIHAWEKVEIPNKRGCGTHNRWTLNEREISEESMELTDADKRAIKAALEPATSESVHVKTEELFKP